jgi:integrase
MPREGAKLTAVAIRNAKKPGLYGDGHGLALQVSESGSKAWIYRYMIGGRARKMGLGAVHTVSLAEAREAALEARKKVRKGIDPIDEANAERAANLLERAKLASIPTFLQCADKFIAAKSGEWSNAKHALMWRRTFHPSAKGEPAATARINSLPVNAIDTPLILTCLEPLWKRAPVTADRVRSRIENVLDLARAHHWRGGDNPAAAKLIQFAMPKVTAGEQHHAALPYADVPAFMADLRSREGIAARLLEMTILTALRRDEARCARWDEIDMQATTWTVPAARMKNRKPHVVPLSDRCVEILESLPRVNNYVFPGHGSEPISDMGVRRLLVELRPDVTLHGMRSSLRDWAGDCTAFPREIAEAALAHQIGSAVEQAYRRGDALQKRRRLMADWAAYCAQPPAKSRDNVVSLKQNIKKV